MISKVKQFLDAAPSALKSANEIYNFARNKYKQIMGVFPDGIDNIALKRGAAEMQDARKKVIKFPEGGKDKTDFFSTRPDPRVKQPPGAKMDIQRANENIAGGSGYAEGDTKYNADVLADEIARMRGANREDLPVKESMKLYSEAYDYLTELNRLNRPSPGKGQLSVTIGGETKNMTPEGIMNLLMGKGKAKDVNIGTAPKTTKTKPAVDPELQKSEDQKQMFLDFEDRIETEAEMLARMKRQNKESVERLKKKKEKDLGDKLKDLPDDIDPDAMAQGGRIGFKEGSGMSRRTFLKLLGGLASIPLVGKFLKPAAKASKAVEVASKSSGVPAYFPKLVEKIKLLGDDITPIAATQERQVVTKYKNYEMTEDLTTGAVQIEKTNIGTGIMGDEVYEGIKSKELIEFKPPETIIGKNNKPVKVPAQYDETTARSTGFDGKLEDFEDGLESIDEILEEVGESKIKKSGGGLAYMMGE